MSLPISPRQCRTTTATDWVKHCRTAVLDLGVGLQSVLDAATTSAAPHGALLDYAAGVMWAADLKTAGVQYA